MLNTQKTKKKAVVAQWIRLQTLNREVPGSNLLAVTVVPLGKAPYLYCFIPPNGFKAVGPLIAWVIQVACFLIGQVK